MPFWKRKADPAKELAEAEIDAARADAEAAVAPGWSIHRYADLEAFTVPGGRLNTYGALAMGPGEERVLAVGVGEANAFRQLVRHLRGELSVAEAWAPPLDSITGKPRVDTFEIYGEDDADAQAALRELEAGLPSGWQPFAIERERYLVKGSELKQLPTFGAAAIGPAGEAQLAIALSEAEAYRALLRRARGELMTSEGWAPPLPGLNLTR